MPDRCDCPRILEDASLLNNYWQHGSSISLGSQRHDLHLDKYGLHYRGLLRVPALLFLSLWFGLAHQNEIGKANRTFRSLLRLNPLFEPDASSEHISYDLIYLARTYNCSDACTRLALTIANADFGVKLYALWVKSPTERIISI